MEKIFAQMIDNAILTPDQIDKIINLAANQVGQTVDASSQ